MKRICSRLIAALCGLAAALLLLPTAALAQGAIDLTRPVELTVHYEHDATPLAGEQFDLYLVATVDKTGELTPTEDFALYSVEIRGKNDEAWNRLAAAMEGYVQKAGLASAASGVTDEAGELAFPTGNQPLTPGLYLLTGRRHEQDGSYYDAAPCFVLLPARDDTDNTWRYSVTVKPKSEITPVPATPGTVTRKVLKVWKDGGGKNRPQSVTVTLLCDGVAYDTVTLNADNNWRHTWTDLDGRCRWTLAEELVEGYTTQIAREGLTFVVTNTGTGPASTPPPKTPMPDRLPQTGQLWWPVPLLLAAGLVLVIAGLLRRRRSGR